MTRQMLATAVLTGLFTAEVAAADLAVEVRGIRSDDGRLFVAVHAPETKETFPAGAGAVAALQQRARAGVIRYMLHDLPPGRYAVNAFHDENDNGELDTNLIGIPSEGFGFANDPDASFGPPDFEAAAVNVGDAGVVAVMTLTY